MMDVLSKSIKSIRKPDYEHGDLQYCYVVQSNSAQGTNNNKLYIIITFYNDTLLTVIQFFINENVIISLKLYLQNIFTF